MSAIGISVFAFFFSLLFAYWGKGLLLYLLYTILFEVVYFLLFRVPLYERLDVIILSIFGYIIGSLIFYSKVSLHKKIILVKLV